MPAIRRSQRVKRLEIDVKPQHSLPSPPLSNDDKKLSPKRKRVNSGNSRQKKKNLPPLPKAPASGPQFTSASQGAPGQTTSTSSLKVLSKPIVTTEPQPFVTKSSKVKATVHIRRALLKCDRLSKIYRVDALLGYGSNGAVLAGTVLVDNLSIPLGTRVAIKCIYKSLGKRVDREVELLKAASQHPNIVRYIDSWEDGSCYFLVTERSGTRWVKSEHCGEVVSIFDHSSDDDEEIRVCRLADAAGWFKPSVDVERLPQSLCMETCNTSTLYEYVDRNSKLSQNVVKNVMRQLLSALNHLHSNDIVHGDLKEENVLMSDSGVCKIIDFGHSRRVISGPPRYLKPLREQHSYDLHTDWVYEIYGTHELSAPEMMPNVDRRNAVKAAGGDAKQVPPHPGTCIFLHDWRQYQTKQGTVVDGRTIPRFSGYEGDVWALGLMMFGMLHGRLPSDHSRVMRSKAVVLGGLGASEYLKDKNHDFGQIYSHYPGAVNPLLEEGCVDLLHSLLATDPRKRITTAEALKHPWLQ